MPPVIDFRCEYTVFRTSGAFTQCVETQPFIKTLASGSAVSVTVSYAPATALAQLDGVAASDAVVEELKCLDQFDGAMLTADARDVVHSALSAIQTAVTDVLSLVKYHLRHTDLREMLFAIKSQQWRAGTDEFRAVPMELSASFHSASARMLDEATHDEVQSALDSGALPLEGMRHLHRARHETEPHHKWIDATIAAELAVKEAICRRCPEMTAVLVEQQSPPFAKLYGQLMRTCLGEESPFRKQLIKGQELRNILVHRPGASKVDPQEALDYVDTVEAAIFHMLSLLYPDDRLIRNARDPLVRTEHARARDRLKPR